jgi:hypothetical protein
LNSRRIGSHPIAPLTTSRPAASSAAQAAPAQTARAWAPRGVARPRPAAQVDGNAFCARALVDIRARVARGEKVRVVFDIDNTLSDGRTRTLAVGQAWDKLNGTHHFDVPKERIGHDAVDTSAALGIPVEQREAFKAYWEKQFWAPESFVHDAPIADAVALVKAAASAGAEVIYLTGRIAELEPATIAQLQRFGLPGVDAEHVVTKASVEVRTTEYRTGWLKNHSPESTAIFFTESTRELADAQAALPHLPAVLLQSQFGGNTPVLADTPIFRAQK